MAKTLKLAALLPVALLSACTGMYVGVQAPEQAQEAELTSEDIASRADIRSINAQSLAELVAEQRASAAKQRREVVSGQHEQVAGYQYLLAPRMC